MQYVVVRHVEVALVTPPEVGTGLWSEFRRPSP